VFVVAGLAVAAGPASAVIYIGVFDPPVFMGTATVDVPTGCIVSDGWVSVASCGGGDTADMLNLVVTNQPAPPVTGMLTFAPPTIINAVFGLYWVGGVLTGIDSSVLGPAAPNGTFSNPGGYGIQFVSGQAPEGTGSPRVNLFTCALFGDVISETCSITSVVGDPATQEPFVRVPEPGSLALLLAALGAGWLALRKTQA
jgi:hypothetical protein